MTDTASDETFSSDESVGEGAFDPDGGEQELLVSRYGRAAARCGRWGDGQWQ